MTTPLTTDTIDTLSAELSAVCAANGIGVEDLAGRIGDPAAAFCAGQVLAGGALSHNTATEAALRVAIAALSS